MWVSNYFLEFISSVRIILAHKANFKLFLLYLFPEKYLCRIDVILLQMLSKIQSEVIQAWRFYMEKFLIMI